MKVTMMMRSQSGVPGAAGVPGGQIGMAQLARALIRLRIDLELLVGGPRMAYLSGLEGIGTTYFGWPSWLDRLIKSSPPGLRSVGASLRRRRWLEAVASLPGIASADIIHVQGLEDAEALLPRFGGPLVVTHWGRAGRWLPHGSSANVDASLPRRIERIRENVRLVAIGEKQRDALASAGLQTNDVIPAGIDLEHFVPGDRAEARRRQGLPADGGIVLFVGRLAADKNVETLLTAFAGLPQRSRRTQLLIVGDGPLRAKLRGLSRDLGIGALTVFVPFVPHQELPSYYQCADVTVVPSNDLETFCMVALEAIACRCPLVVTDQVPEILRRFPTVPSFAPYDVESLRDHLTAALDGRVQPADITRLGDYDWGSIARRYLDVYQTAMRRVT